MFRGISFARLVSRPPTNTVRAHCAISQSYKNPSMPEATTCPLHGYSVAVSSIVYLCSRSEREAVLFVQLYPQHWYVCICTKFTQQKWFEMGKRDSSRSPFQQASSKPEASVPLEWIFSYNWRFVFGDEQRRFEHDRSSTSYALKQLISEADE